MARSPLPTWYFALVVVRRGHRFLLVQERKYGETWSIPGGRVEVSWDMMTEKLARIEWRESGGPPVAERRRSGFGTELIEKIVAHELKNPVSLRFDLSGVRCTLIVPVRQPVAFQLRQGAPDSAANS